MRPNAARRLMAVRELGTVVLLGIVIVAAGLREPRFLKADSIESILLWLPLLLVVGAGQMMVIVTRGIDVSVGSMVGLSAMAAGMLFRAEPNVSIAVGTGVGILVGLGLGSLNGVLIAFANVPPIIATLGTMSAYRGIIFIVSHGRQVDSNYIPDALSRWSESGPFQIARVTLPWIVVIAVVVAAGAAWFLRKTRPGRNVFAFGSNPEAARLRGVAVNRTVFMVYAITGALCGLAGVLYASRFGFVNPGTAGQGLELMVIAAVVIGGTNVAGGSGTILGVLLGSALLGSINVALAVLGIDERWQQLVYGVVILGAVLIDAFIRRAVERSGAERRVA